MRLQDLLSGEQFKELNSMRYSQKSKSKNKKNKKLNKSKKNENRKNGESVDRNLNNKNNKSKKRESIGYFENKVERTLTKARLVRECTYCGSDNLEITASGYYVCEDCGVRVDKR